ncbi:hypothetical protein MBM_04422 [Drepanopeziza brunnea f. sp. 'multigermtubi' MB_m1]|uniref:Uncharacterized protein n=1 Tax=Marssonina brunnea f. sp. multigermtubi (strain MB_m1) TaxID=1072389 RepID=K1WWU9_MARBU|nr:uncharacterized protein MBM_04422 [Drepanopeziza brunnea f. sp. 'multigermtubi' MB_m1]EKD17561.1 hypothetical protein MBM_04422 [Drepanopeziza brunnea f. sp. 'multigermtubi' MB_m1]
MMPFSQYICSILLALSFLLSRAPGEGRDQGEGREVIGCRTVSDVINTPTGLEAAEDECYCVITADSEKLTNTAKVWIPERAARVRNGKRKFRTLWHRDDRIVLNYIASMVPGDPEKALRFSEISYEPVRMLKMDIATDMINNDDLGLWARCWKRKGS